MLSQERKGRENLLSAGAIKKPLGFRQGAFVKEFGSVLLSHTVARAVPSPQESLTSVFGMGTGGTSPLWPPKNYTFSLQSSVISYQSRVSRPLAGYFKTANCKLPTDNLKIEQQGILVQFIKDMVKPHGLLVSVSSIHYWTSTSDLSTSSSLTSLEVGTTPREILSWSGLPA